MNDQITLTGIVATTPRHIVTAEGLDITSFRLASVHSHYDRTTQLWVDDDTNWYTITAFRQLAANSYDSITKGDHVVLSGRLQIRDWETDDKHGTSIDITAHTLGHDLSYGTTTYNRNRRPRPDTNENSN